MAGTATLTQTVALRGGMGGKKMNIGHIVSTGTTVTIEAPTNLSRIDSFTFGEAGSGGAVDVPTIDETVTSGSAGGAIVTSSGFVTVDWATTGSRTMIYTFIGV